MEQQAEYGADAGQAEKTYLADRQKYGTRVQVVTEEGQYPLKHICGHSPDGFEWGYGGSGPSDLARSILIDAVGQVVADIYYHSFKWEFIAKARFEGFQIRLNEILAWLDEQRKEA